MRTPNEDSNPVFCFTPKTRESLVSGYLLDQRYDTRQDNSPGVTLLDSGDRLLVYLLEPLPRRSGGEVY